MPAPLPTGTPPPRRPARDLIEAVLENMRRNLEPLKYSTLAPSRYVVYLHPTEFARLEEVMPVLKEQTARALDEELQRLNAASLTRRMFGRVLGATPPVENPARAWQIEFMADPDGDVAEGDILIHSDLRARRTRGAWRGAADQAGGNDARGRPDDGAGADVERYASRKREAGGPVEL